MSLKPMTPQDFMDRELMRADMAEARALAGTKPWELGKRKRIRQEAEVARKVARAIAESGALEEENRERNVRRALKGIAGRREH